MRFQSFCSKLAGINSKTWCLIYNRYDNCSSYVRLNQHVSAPFKLEHGVRQGFILSPSLFLLVMDPLLRQFQSLSSGQFQSLSSRQFQSLSSGLSVNNTYAGAYLHAGDIRTLANSLTSLKDKISIVLRFTSENFMKLNAAECEVIMFLEARQLISLAN